MNYNIEELCLPVGPYSISQLHEGKRQIKEKKKEQISWTLVGEDCPK